MTLGEKIKKYRELRELTQRELGQKVGFSAGTEDSRIRKYEKNMKFTQIRRSVTLRRLILKKQYAKISTVIK